MEKLRGIMKAGVEIVQLRDKDLSTRELLELSRKAKKVIKDRALFFINDCIDLALAVGAQGVHLGQDDLPVEVARRIAGKKMLIGFSTHTAEQVKKSVSKPVDYISFGPVFKTKTKLDAVSPRGINRLRKAVSYSRHPVVAVGGIKKGNAGEVIKSGASGVAVCSGILDARDTYRATIELRSELHL
ncbi:MAG: thiamine phosphate synthase [Candidatus Omnitrophica bacterium]|nr:thiamine phosphate synthase [Candidatus Omnitrophota bacterium]